MGTTFRLFWTNEAVLILYGGVISVSTWAVTLRQKKERSKTAIDFISNFLLKCRKYTNYCEGKAMGFQLWAMSYE